MEEGQLCRRKSLAEVDLNRNWGVAWRSGAPRGGEEHGGDKPFSEPQSRALRDLATADPPVAYANVHSGEWALYVPWDHKKARSFASLSVLAWLYIWAHTVSVAAGACGRLAGGHG